MRPLKDRTDDLIRDLEMTGIRHKTSFTLKEIVYLP